MLTCKIMGPKWSWDFRIPWWWWSNPPRLLLLLPRLAMDSLNLYYIIIHLD